MASAGDTFNFKLYRYVPSLAAAVVATVVFGSLSVAHIFRIVRNKTWFCVPFVVGGLCMLSSSLLI